MQDLYHQQQFSKLGSLFEGVLKVMQNDFLPEAKIPESCCGNPGPYRLNPKTLTLSIKTAPKT